jgi:TPR repeat protein
MHYLHVVALAVFLLPPPLASAGDSQTGQAAFDSADYETALAEWQPLAEAGDAGGAYGLGQMYGNGFGVMMDDALAIKWYSLAADQGHARAQYNLAVMYQNGWGVAQSDTEAMNLYTLAAEQGVSEAMVAAGRLLAMDFADGYDPVQAYKWFSLAYSLDDIDASTKRDSIAAKMTAEQKAEGDALITAWSEENADLLADNQ